MWSEHVTQSDSKFCLWKCEYCGLNEPKWKKAALFIDNSFLNSNYCGPWIVTWIVPFTVNERSVVVFSITGIQMCFFCSVLVASSSLTLPCEGHGWQRSKLRFFPSRLLSTFVHRKVANYKALVAISPRWHTVEYYMNERTADHFEPKKNRLFPLGVSAWYMHTLHTNRERRELQELQKKFMDNVSVGILSSFLVLSGCGF